MVMIKMPQLSPASGMNMFMLLFITFWVMLFLIQLKKLPMISSFNNLQKSYKKINNFFF
uniref:ATP synthase F0 subunit 8 n=1 Tax=Achatinella fulgens TaxID=115939 RepID=A0A3S9AFH4_9EUPU|nr:ATP synthase F0 subunit 8 [Achatinella fulgens]